MEEIFSDKEIEEMNRLYFEPDRPDLEVTHKPERRFLATLAARDKWIEKLSNGMVERQEIVADQAATIDRLRGALEPFAPTFDIIHVPEAYGVFLGGLIKNNFIEARQALDTKEKS